MAMRSVLLLSRGFRVSMDSTSRGAMSRFYSSDKGRVLSEEEQAKENVYIQKWERERLEKLKQQTHKVKSDKDKDTADKAYHSKE
ncbi:putative NADH:ubiquinone reductase (H(+)-translocating) [Lupinus albus]|uniref:Putative NADH:ubiquinone reductase (H(+)-translocating) n=1 Tax=Lupinus albus TaxID=3870 RepID=A0A6A4QF22_LUPAL|nr:putative NADH:ubiquinone reductase (H(+)-translocating) [Lupinus albus]